MRLAGLIDARPDLHVSSKNLESASEADLPDDDAGLRPDPCQQLQHCGLRHGDAAGGWRELLTRQMQKHGTATAGDARRRVVIDLNDEVVEVIGTTQMVASLITVEANVLVVVSV